ncbi:MAG: tetratricopeptide repeat protein [Gemmatimonadales bacterium]
MGMTEFLLVVAVGGGIIAVLSATFRGAAAEGGGEERPDAADVAAEVDGGRGELEDRRRAAVHSLEEIEADYESGNLSEADYQTLRRRYEKEVASLERLLASDEEPPVSRTRKEPAAPARRGSWTTSLGWAAGTVAFVALAWLVMSQTLRPRGEGDTITGSLPGQDQGMGPAGAPVANVDMNQLAELRRIVSEDPDNVEALVELGHLYLSLQNYDELSTVTQQALALDPENPEALTHLGMLLFSTGHPQGVMASFDRALAIDPDFGEALQFKGMVAFIQRDYQTAVEAWQRYLDVVPPDEVAPRIRGMLEAARVNLGSTAAPQAEGQPEGEGSGG